MPEYWILGEENVAGISVLRKLATSKNKQLADEIFDAIEAGDAYNKIYLVQVVREG